MVRISGRLADADGETVITALRRACERSGPEPPGNRPSGEQRYADALVHLASSALAHDVDRDRACVLLHVPHDAAARLAETDLSVAPETARRLVCDAILQVLVTDALERPVGLSPRRRTVSAPLLRVLRHRDRRCRFPGCERTRGLHAHHLVHAADGGPTRADNLYVHEHRWQIRGDPTRADGLVFRRPDGHIYPVNPPPLEPEIRTRFLANAPTRAAASA